LTTVIDGQNVPTIRAYGSGTTNLTTANQQIFQFNFPLPVVLRTGVHISAHAGLG
jgi:hypothetical protein